ncbi:MAG: helix-turn-helix domain-containing protein [Treponema sp.]|nr:helix-turn-helix domain-containing protein [Treponema sp.]
MINHSSSQKVITVKELAEQLKIGRDSAYALVRSGQIYSLRIGRQIRIPKTAVDLYLSGQTQACKEAAEQV